MLEDPNRRIGTPYTRNHQRKSYSNLKLRAKIGWKIGSHAANNINPSSGKKKWQMTIEIR